MDQLSSLFGGNQTQIQPFQSAGGITPQQQALADYTRGQGYVGTENQFGKAGTGMSTMDTQAESGNEFAKAKLEGSMSDIDQTAMYDLYQNDVNSELQTLAANNANQGAEQNALGKLIGGAFGTNTSNFGTG